MDPVSQFILSTVSSKVHSTPRSPRARVGIVNIDSSPVTTQGFDPDSVAIRDGILDTESYRNPKYRDQHFPRFLKKVHHTPLSTILTSP